MACSGSNVCSAYTRRPSSSGLPYGSSSRIVLPAASVMALSGGLALATPSEEDGADEATVARGRERLRLSLASHALNERELAALREAEARLQRLETAGRSREAAQLLAALPYALLRE